MPQKASLALKSKLPNLPHDLEKSGPGTLWLSLGVVFVGTWLRFIYLDADPRYYQWVGYITDEGRWVQHARNLALQGTLADSSDLNFHLFMAPFFEFLNYLVFKLIGVSLLSSRILTALCGSAILALFWGCLRRAVSPQALLVGVTLLALQSDLVAMSRVAVPEMVVMGCQLGVYFLIVSGTSRQMATAGLLMLVACGMKATVILLLPIFSVMILVMPRKATDTRRWGDLLLFLIGFLVSGLIGGGIGYLLVSDRVLNLVHDIQDLETLVQAFLGVPKPFLYSVLSFPFEDPLSYTFNLWSLGVWLTAVVWWASGPGKIDFRLHRHLTASGIWLALYFILMLSLEYFPTRYKIHVLIPMALFITFGMNLIQRIGVGEVIRSLAEPKGRLGLLWLTTLSLPTAAFLTPLLTSIIALAGVDSPRLSAKLSCFLFLLVAITDLARRAKGNRRAVSLFLMFPLMEGMVWLMLPLLENAHSFWPTVGLADHAGYFSLGILAAIVLSLVLLRAADQWRRTDGSAVITVLVMCYLTVSLVRIVPGYLDRHYSIRDSSRDLGRLLPASSKIASFRADTLFNNNDLRYSSFSLSSERPDFLVVAFDSTPINSVLKEEYSFIKSYHLWIPPECDYSESNSSGHAVDGLIPTYDTDQTGRAVVARVYRHIYAEQAEQRE